MSAAAKDRRSLFLLLSVLLFILASPFLEIHRLGDAILIVSVYVTFAAVILELYENRTLRWMAVLFAAPSISVMIAGLFHPARIVVIAGYALLMTFFGFASVGLFGYLGQPGSITSGRIYASVSLYLLLGLFWFTD